MNLDDVFGPAIPPVSEFPWEKTSPASLSKLNAQTAASFKLLMGEIRAGWVLGRVLMDDILIIWLVDVAGDIWFALEELVIDGLPIGCPKHQTVALTRSAAKLGHPSLVRCANARIGGEIVFDPPAA